MRAIDSSNNKKVMGGGSRNLTTYIELLIPCTDVCRRSKLLSFQFDDEFQNCYTLSRLIFVLFCFPVL